MPRDIHRHYGPAELAEDLSGLFLGLPQLGLDLLDGRQRSLELLWELFEMLEHGDAHRSRCVPESVFGNDSIFRFAQNEADADRKSTRLNSSHLGISYAVFCL